MLIEFHVLQNHAPSNLNRDESGSPKECVFGGHKRARISSQCLKRSIRRSDVFENLYAQEGFDNLDPALRIQKVPTLMGAHLRESELAEETEIADIVSLLPRLLASSAEGDEAESDKTSKPADGKTKDTKQLVFTSAQEYKALAEVLLEQLRADSKTFRTLLDDKAKEIKKKRATFARKISKEMAARQDARQENIRTSPDIALFGRMTTSAAFVDVQASLQAAHAFSTNKVDHEFDFFTAIDDLKDSVEDDPGAGHLNDTEFNSACYYKYFSIDVNGFVDNLLDKSRRGVEPSPHEQQQAQIIAAQVIDAFVRAMTMTTPTGKQNSFAAHQLPAAILVEVRPHSTPVSYANAFVEPARPGRDGDLVEASLKKFGAHVQALTDGFNLRSNTRLLLAPEHDAFAINGVTRCASLSDLCGTLRQAVGSDNGGGNG